MRFRLTTRGLTIAAILLTVVVVGIGVALAATSTPQFCAPCKSHVPYVDEWRASAHDGVNCEQCHSKPGPFFFLTAKLEALQQPIAQITGDYEKPILGYVLNQSCRRCHNNDLLFNPVSKNGIRVQHKHLIEAGFLCMRCHSTQAHGDGGARGLAHLPEHGPVPDLPQQPVQGAGRPGGHVTLRPLPHRAGLRRRPRDARGARLVHAARRRRHPLHLQRLPHQEGRLLQVPQRHPHAAPRGVDLRARPRRRGARRQRGVRPVPRHQAVLQDLPPGARCRTRTDFVSSSSRGHRPEGRRHLLQLPRRWPTARRATSMHAPATRRRTSCSRRAATRCRRRRRRAPSPIAGGG